MFFILTTKGKECIDTIKCDSNEILELITKINEI